MTHPTDPAQRHPGIRDLLEHFEFGHLPDHLAAVSSKFHALASELLADLPDSAELTAGLRKLLEAKDCAVRAAVVAAKDADQANTEPSSGA